MPPGIYKRTPEMKTGKYIKSLYHRKNTSKRMKDLWKDPEYRKMMSEKHKGGRCHTWKGGISFEPYSVDWTKTLKKSIRQRDRYTCQICGEEPSLNCHHIDYNKNNCDTSNLIILCKKCHGKTNINRKYWISFFQKILKDRYDYEYTDNQEIKLEIKP